MDIEKMVNEIKEIETRAVEAEKRAITAEKKLEELEKVLRQFAKKDAEHQTRMKAHAEAIASALAALNAVGPIFARRGEDN